MRNVWFEGLEERIADWLREDVGTGDVTTLATIEPEHRSVGIIHAKDDGVVAGLPVAKAVFRVVDPELRFETIAEEGSTVTRGTTLAKVEGRTQSILIGERLALNLLQRLSGIATLTRRLADRMGGSGTRLADTRKTTPGLRQLEKYAVRVGGGSNHRFGLYDAVMIKDNHIKGAGGVAKAIGAARAAVPHTMKIEVEVERDDQLEEAISASADIIMLDNMRPERMAEAIRRIKDAKPHIIVEASGGVTEANIAAIAATGVDVISSGSLTTGARNLDISLDLGEKKEVSS